MRREENLTYEEIADRRKTSIATVRNQVASALGVYREEFLAADFRVPPKKSSRSRGRATSDVEAGGSTADGQGGVQ
jgi:hypothetical protein